MFEDSEEAAEEVENHSLTSTDQIIPAVRKPNGPGFILCFQSASRCFPKSTKLLF